MQTKLTIVKESQKSILRQLVELYEYDFSEFNDNDLNEHGYYGYRYLDHYWTEKGRMPFFIKVQGKLVGFILVNDYCYILRDENAKSIAEFFVLRKYRRRGVGRSAAFQIFDRYPGMWEVIQHLKNKPAIQFWENTIKAYTQDNFRKKVVQTDEWQGQALIFDNSKER